MEAQNLLGNLLVNIEKPTEIFDFGSLKDQKEYCVFEAYIAKNECRLFVSRETPADFSYALTSYRRFRLSSAKEVVFVFCKMKNVLASEFIKEGVPFLDTAGNAFLPFIGLRNNDSNRGMLEKEPLSLLSQRVASIFLFSKEEIISAKDMGSILSISQPTVARGLKYFLNNGFIEIIGPINRARYGLQITKKDLFKSIRGELISPIAKTFYVKKESIDNMKGLILSSESALEELSEIVASIESYVLPKGREKEISSLSIPAWSINLHDNLIRFDKLSYEPLLFGKNCLNPLDVFAIFARDEDPRIKEALEKIGQTIQ